MARASASLCASTYTSHTDSELVQLLHHTADLMQVKHALSFSTQPCDSPQKLCHGVQVQPAEGSQTSADAPPAAGPSPSTADNASQTRDAHPVQANGPSTSSGSTAPALKRPQVGDPQTIVPACLVPHSHLRLSPWQTARMAHHPPRAGHDTVLCTSCTFAFRKSAATPFATSSATTAEATA